MASSPPLVGPCPAKSSLPLMRANIVSEYPALGGITRRHWANVGMAFPHRDGKGYSVVLSKGISVSGELVLREPDRMADGSAGESLAEPAAAEPASIRIVTKTPPGLMQAFAKMAQLLDDLEGVQLADEGGAHGLRTKAAELRLQVDDVLFFYGSN